jgi:hypothetical protein
MAIHRDLMRGTGSYDTLNRYPDRLSDTMHAMVMDDEAQPPKPLRSLPRFNFFEIEDPVLKDAILQDALPADRSRMESYGTNRDANIALISAPVSTPPSSIVRVRN